MKSSPYAMATPIPHATPHDPHSSVQAQYSGNSVVSAVYSENFQSAQVPSLRTYTLVSFPSFPIPSHVLARIAEAVPRSSQQQTTSTSLHYPE
ncbi:hypothetical protein IAQ61_008821 [Plenodomus lingam]|uniref:uncharacterized protein n=1 Tax=Leptosphaeria maculans TaxID=5022 RepID=UPI00331CB681|nr:hypothetical protein IAQ61_008821 [Plenodomus lingam]